jgi:hypothetical protein
MLRIKDWVERFEAKREKDRPKKSMEWIALPCDLSSTGYGLLMQQPNGAQHLGVFVALLEIVADLPGAIRDGKLINERQAPLSLEAMSVKTRIPVSTMSQSIAALKACGWLVDQT